MHGSGRLNWVRYASAGALATGEFLAVVYYARSVTPFWTWAGTVAITVTGVSAHLLLRKPWFQHLVRETRWVPKGGFNLGTWLVGGTHLKVHVFKQLPLLPPSAYKQPTPWVPTQSVLEWMRPLVVELMYTALDLQPFARDLHYEGPPFHWNRERRLHLRCELDAAFFHLYGICRSDVDYIMDTFPIVRRNDKDEHEAYRRKLLILELYERLKYSIDTHEPYQPIVRDSPADPAIRTKPSSTEPVS